MVKFFDSLCRKNTIKLCDLVFAGFVKLRNYQIMEQCNLVDEVLKMKKVCSFSFKEFTNTKTLHQYFIANRILLV